MLDKKKILIFTATYNEKDNIENLIRSINNNNLKVDIYIIDDLSPDKTYIKIPPPPPEPPSPPKALPEIGWSQIFIYKSNKDFKALFEDPFHVLHWHGDRILLPPSAELIASSNACKEQLFKIGPFAYGLQFHLEIEDEMVFKWINEDSDFIRSALGQNARFLLQEQQKKFVSLASKIILVKKKKKKSEDYLKTHTEEKKGSGKKDKRCEVYRF